MSRTQQDQFIDDDEEETCPLCVEEFDLTDKGFRPCPCGYQICQFCYHNVKTNINGLCPACRRPYEDKNIEYKVITPEETAAHKARQAQKQKKTQAALQKEKQKAEADHLSRKHLAGLRVVQKNLVYVTGLSPTSQEDQLLQTLRGDQYFGQYGKIIKIVVSKARDPAHPNSVGVYVTYERKEDAQACIVAVNGSKNGDRTLRAQFGTTKYCSAYLRNEQCTNRNCMFLHEPGEANESYSRADLSALNAGSSQHGGDRPPPPQSQLPMASAAPPPAATPSTDNIASLPSRPALPSTASWASKPTAVAPNRPESRATAASIGSPAVSLSTPAPSESAAPAPAPTPAREVPVVAPASTQPSSQASDPPNVPKVSRAHTSLGISPLIALLKNFVVEDLEFRFDTSAISPSDLEVIKNYPPLFEENGGARRRLRRQREEEQRSLNQSLAFPQSSADQDDAPEMSGSLQLGGEPEERLNSAGPRSAGGDGLLDQRFRFGDGSTGIGGERGATPQSHQQLLLQTMKGSSDSSYMGPGSAFPGASSQPNTSAPPGHQRNVSRYSFANDSASATMSVKPVASSKLLNQQSAMMPSSAGGQYGNPQDLRLNTNQQFFTSNVQGPPPGLKTTGTPVSGGMTFGQGHGFTTGGLQYGPSAGRHNNSHEDNMRSLLRGPTNEAAVKRDIDFPPLGPPSRQHSISLNETRNSTPPVPPGFDGQVANGSRRSTPSIPPGFIKPLSLAHLDDESTASRPHSRASLRRQVSQHVDVAIPLRPSRPTTPAVTSSQPEGGADTKRNWTTQETPTKSSRKSTKQAQILNERHTSTAIEKKDPTVEKLDPEDASPADTVPASANDDGNVKSMKPTSSTLKSTTTPVKPKKLDDQTEKRADANTNTASSSSVEGPKTGGTTDGNEVNTPVRSAKPSLTTSIPVAVSPGVSTASPATKQAPKTLRLVGTAPQASTSTNVAQIFPNVATRQPSRQPSLASMTIPGTPSSEQVSFSDNVSITSASLSRANSPPPFGGKVGTAPVRTKTKSQLKKERQERAKALEEEKVNDDETTKPSEEEPAQEAIVSRKKKAKKEKEPKIKPKPKTKTVSMHESDVPSQATPPSPKPQVTLTPEVVAKPVIVEKPFALSPSPVESPRSYREPSPPPTPTMTPAALLAEIQAARPEIQRCMEAFFRTPTSNQLKPGQNITAKDLRDPYFWKPDLNVQISKEETEALLRELIPAKRYGGEQGRVWDRGMVTPSGAHLRAMTEELENRFLELEKTLREMPDELRFHPSKPQNEMRFPNINLEKLHRQFENANARGISVMEQMVQDGSTMKKGAFLVDEASKYINEFVMPPATPPPSTGKTIPQQGPPSHPSGNNGGNAGSHGHAGSNHAHGHVHGHGDVFANASPDILERQIHEAKRVHDERESALRKVIKKNKKLLGLN